MAIRNTFKLFSRLTIQSAGRIPSSRQGIVRQWFSLLSPTGLASRFLAVIAVSGFMFSSAGAAEVGEDGLHIQPWFMDSFLDLRDDLQELTAQGKRFAVIWEQRGCPYCRETHEVNFAEKRIADYIKANFGVLQLNMWGSRKVTDFDGEELEERALAQKWRVIYTPTIVFFGDKLPAEATSANMEVMRMPGYFKRFHFMSMFEYVAANAYKDQPFQRFIQHKFDELKAKGIKPDIW